MKNYDMAFSLGFSCGCSRALRKAGLQFASYPLDWTGSPGVKASAEMIANDFAGWLDRDDLELVDIRAGRFGNRIYRSRSTRFGFPHEFSSFLTFDEAYGPTVEKHRRRIARLMANLRKAKRVFAAYIERPIDRRASDDDLVAAKRTLERKFPGASFDLAYFFQTGEGGGARETPVADGITAVACDYRQMKNGEVWHEIDYDGVSEWMKQHVAVADPRTDAEKAAYAASKAREKRRRFEGEKNPLKRKWNEWEYKLYRHLDEVLQKKGVLPREKALWF